MIIVTCRNNLALTKACMNTLLAQHGSPPVLAIDNASSDGTYRWLGTQPVDRMYGHYGSVSEMWNTGLRYAWKQGFDRALVVNNDVELHPEVYCYLSAYDAPFVTCVSVNTREQFTPPAADWNHNPREHPDFSCFMIHKSVTDQIGWFDEEYRIAFAEDADYHVRMHRAGIRAVCVDIPFFHHGSATIKNADKAEQERIAAQAEKNRERFYQTYGKRIGTPEYDELFTPETFGSSPPAVAGAASLPEQPTR